MILKLRVKHGADVLAREIGLVSSRLDAAMREGTRGGAQRLKVGLTRLTERRTSMSSSVAARVIESDFRPLPAGGRGVVGYKPPPPGGWAIRPKNGKALAFSWPGAPASVGPPRKNGKYVFKGVQHPGSRPYKLVRESAMADERAIRDGYLDEVGRALE